MKFRKSSLYNTVSVVAIAHISRRDYVHTQKLVSRPTNLFTMLIFLNYGSLAV